MKLVKSCGDDAQDRVDGRIGIRGTVETHYPCTHGKTEVKTMMMMICSVLIAYNKRFILY